MLDRLADLVTRRRVLVLLLVLGLSAALAAFIPRLRADFTPSDLFAKFEDQEAIAAEFRAEFGNTDNVLLVLVESPDVLSQPTLQYIHDLTRWLREQPFAARVDAVTTLPIPREPGAAERATATSGIIAALYTVSALTSTQVGNAAGEIRGVPRDDASTPRSPRRSSASRSAAARCDRPSTVTR